MSAPSRAPALSRAPARAPSSAEVVVPDRFPVALYNGHTFTVLRSYVVDGNFVLKSSTQIPYDFQKSTLTCTKCNQSIYEGIPNCKGPQERLSRAPALASSSVKSNTHPASVSHGNHENRAQVHEKHPKSAFHERVHGDRVNHVGDQRPAKGLRIPRNAGQAKKLAGMFFANVNEAKSVNGKLGVCNSYGRVLKIAEKQLQELTKAVEALRNSSGFFTHTVSELGKGAIAVSSNSTSSETKEIVVAELSAAIDSLELEEALADNDSGGGNLGIKDNVSDSNRSAWGDGCENGASASAEASLH
jgi:hypothetical protein